MKILLAQPSWDHVFGRMAHAGASYASPPIGMGLLASLARDAGHEVLLVDGHAEREGVEATAARVAAAAPDVVGLSGMTPTHSAICELARRLRELLPSTPLIVGGVHVTLLGAEALTPDLDYGFRGEAEEQWLKVLEVLAGRRDPAGVPGLVWRRPDGVLVDNGIAPVVADLDTLPEAAWDLYRLDAYRESFSGHRNVRFVNLVLSRGCPFPCVFCSAAALQGRKARYRSAAKLVAEMRTLAERFDVRHFMFQDSNLTMSRRAVVELCEHLLASGLDVTFEGWTRADLIDRELLVLLKRAGLVRIQFGIESGSPAVLQRLQKHVSHEQIRAAFRLAGELGLETSCTAMMGLPGETEADVWQTVRFIRSIPEIGHSPLSIAIPYPGTELRRMAESGEHGLRLLGRDWDQYRRYDGGVMEVNGMSPEQLQRLQKRALIWMHLTPRKLVATVRRFGLRTVVRAVLGR
jgi:radical SAM superfamily enzyme YgiQ (UPF0313 family)